MSKTASEVHPAAPAASAGRAGSDPVGPSWLRSAALWADERLHWLAGAGLVATTTLFAILALWICASGVPTIRGVDLNVVFTMQKMLRGLPLYTDPAQAPFDVAQYSPLYYLVCTTLARILGATEPAPLLLLARTVSTLCAVLTAVLMVAVARRLLGVRPSLAYAAAMFGFIATAPWLFLARPDALATLAIMTACALALAAIQDPARGILYATLAALASVVAVFAKQSGLPAGAIVVLVFAVTGRWRLMFVAVGVGGLAGAAAGALAIAQWPFLFENVVRGVDNGLSVTNAFAKTYTNFVYPFGTLLGAALLILLAWIGRGLTATKAWFVVALPVLMVFATVTGLKAQSAENYYNEWILIATLAVVAALEEMRQGGAPATAPPLARVLSAVLLCWLPFWSVSQVRFHWWERLDHSAFTPINSLWNAGYADLRRLVERESTGSRRYVLAFVLPANNALPAHALVPQKEVAEVMHRRGLVDYGQLETLIRRGEVGVMVTPREWSRTPPSFLGVPLPPTEPIAEVDDLRVWRVAAVP